MNFRDIPRFPRANYEVNVFWGHIERFLDGQDPKIDLEPDFQRGHVWSMEQQIAFVEYGLMGGENSMIITTNCPGWIGVGSAGPYQLVDGLQRITAVRQFVAGRIPAFGRRIDQYADRLGLLGPSFRWRVCTLQARAEVLRLYLLMNAGGVVHSPEEIARVRGLLEREPVSKGDSR